MAERTFFQWLAAGAVEFFEFVEEWLGDDLTRASVIQDLGGDPAAAPTGPVFPSGRLAAIKAYQDKADADRESGITAMADAVALLDFIASTAEGWAAGPGEGVEEFTHSLLALSSTTWVRLRYPRVFFLLQAFQTIEEIGSTYGPGDGSFDRIGTGLAALMDFIFSPGKTLEKLDSSNPLATDTLALSGDVVLSFASLAFGWFTGNKPDAVPVAGDILYGWDAPGLDIDSAHTPSKADAISARMASISLIHDSDDPADDPEVKQHAYISLALVPRHLGGTAVMIAVGGSMTVEDAPISERWTFTQRVRSDAGAAVLLGGDKGFQFGGPSNGTFLLSFGWTSQPKPPSRISFALPAASGTRLEIGQLAATLAITESAGEIRLTLADSALVIDSSDNDGLIRELLGGTPLRLPFNLTVGYSTSRGLILEGGVAPASSPAASDVRNSPLAGDGAVGQPIIAATIPIGRKYGPVTIHEVAVRLARGAADVPNAASSRIRLEADVSFSAQFGPMYLRLDQLGLGLVLDDGPPVSERNLRFIDAHVGIKPPLGIAVSVDSEIVTGGGTLLHDPVRGTYFGALVLSFDNGMMLKANGLIATRNPDGSTATSMIIIATLEGLGWTIGSLNIDGLGVLIAVNRTFDATAVRAALPTGALRNVLFPADPLHHTSEILSSLTTFFPARRGAHMIGILAKLSFGKPVIVRLDVALIYAWGDHRRLIVLGRLSSILPEDVGLLRLNLDAVGIVDFTDGTVSVDAVLIDSKLSDRFVLTGAAALRGDSGTGGFALAVGGLHPKFPAPAGFPTLPRITLAFTTGDNPRLVCQAYLALTSNTIQFGASATLFAAACGFSIEGSVGFDVLIQLLPFHYLAEFHASVQLKRGSHNLFKVSVQGALEGPLPLRIAGKASFEILWCDFSVHFDRTLVGGSTPADVPGIDALGELRRALGNPVNWSPQTPVQSRQPVSVRTDNRVAGVVLHPLGRLTVRQSVVPLNLSRDIDRIGTASPSGVRRFTITLVTLGPMERPRRSVRDLFAPAQYFDMSDDDKLAAPSFEQMDAGVSFGDDEYVFDMGSLAISAFEYTDISIGLDGKPTVKAEPHRLEGAQVLIMLLTGAAARAPTRRTLSARFQAPVHESAPELASSGWAAADVGSITVPASRPTWIEAQADLRVPGAVRRVLVPQNELLD